MKDQLYKKKLIIIVVAASILLSATICFAQFVHYRKFKRINLSDYETIDCLCEIEKMTWLNTDYDIISGWVIKSDPVEPSYRWNTQIVFYTDDSDQAFTLPLKLVTREDIPEKIDAEGIYNSEDCGFIGTIHRRSGLRNTHKIGFLIDVNGEFKLAKTGIDYKYMEQ